MTARAHETGLILSCAGKVGPPCIPSEDTLIPQGLWAISRASVVLAEVPCPVMASGWGLGGSLFSVQPSLNLLAYTICHSALHFFFVETSLPH